MICFAGINDWMGSNYVVVWIWLKKLGLVVAYWVVVLILLNVVFHVWKYGKKFSHECHWRLQEFCFGGSLKNFNKKRTWIYRVTDTKKKKIIIIIHEVLQFPSTCIQILNCCLIVHYKYLLPMWVDMSL